MSRRRPFGSWPSPISARMLASAGVSFSDVATDGDVAYWIESRPHEGARNVIVATTADGRVRDMLSAGFSARSRVHEYGGGAFGVRDGVVVFVEDADQRLYRVVDGHAPVPLTPEPAAPRAVRHADIQLTDPGDVICVVEAHEAGREPTNMIRRIASGGEHTHTLHEGRDFYSCPRVSPDGAKLAWIAWDHPHMPWDAAEAWVASLDASGELVDARRVAGGGGTSVSQVEWSPDGVLHVVDDRSGFWNVYRVEANGCVPVAPTNAEMGHPLWVFGTSTLAFRPDGSLFGAAQSEGEWSLGLLERGGEGFRPLEVPYTDLGRSPRIVSDAAGRVLFAGGNPRETRRVVRGTLEPTGHMVWEVLRSPPDPGVPAELLSTPRSLRVEGDGSASIHAFYYPPCNDSLDGLDGERPPLLVEVHGGPTTCTSSALSLERQFWTSRGFALVDVNYGGSSGFGRAYRERLREGWGVVDVADCVAVARELAASGLVDGRRLAIRGGSAGGFTTLSALVFHDAFAAGASSYGIGDLEALAAETHKFESRYNDYLLGPYPETRDRWLARSPLHGAERLSRPVILLQGLEDAVVPPAQAERFVEVLEAKRVTHAYVTFPDEGHGFRKAENVVRALEAELAFFGHVFGFEPADDLAPLDIRFPRP